MTKDNLEVEPYANFGSGEPWVARVLLQWQSVVNAVPAFAATRDVFHLAQAEVFESLGMAFQVLRKLRMREESAAPVLELAESYASLYGHLWQAYKDRFQRALGALGVDFGFFWDNDSKFELGAEALLLETPEFARLVDLMRSYRESFHNALGYYRNTYLEHREAEVDKRMLESFHRLEAAEDTFEKVWLAIEVIVAGIVVVHLPRTLALVETPEGERNPARPERFRVDFRGGYRPYPTDPSLRAERDEKGRLIGKPFIEVAAGGRRYRAVGDRLAIRPESETDHEFFIVVLCMILGNEWNETQGALSEDDRHIVHRWVEQWEALRRGEKEAIDKKQEGEHRFTATATGELQALLCLAYDVYTLKHAISLPDALVSRLLHADQFQGARYELAVAAVFVRAGYALEWITANNRKLPEFIARHPQTGSEIAVEAKSRHRLGVLGRAGDTPDLESLKVDVAGLMRTALEKETDGRPFVICLDLNLPTVPDRTFEQWLPELHDNVLAQFGDERTGEHDPYAAVFFTNYSWHWDGEQPAGSPMHFVVVSKKAVTPLPEKETVLLAEALFQYGDVPQSGA